MVELVVRAQVLHPDIVDGGPDSGGEKSGLGRSDDPIETAGDNRVLDSRLGIAPRIEAAQEFTIDQLLRRGRAQISRCLLYTSDAADE